MPQAALDELIAGLQTSPTPSGIAVPDEALPAGAQIAAQGPISPWFQPDWTRPQLSTRWPGESELAVLRLPDPSGGTADERLVRIVVTTALKADEIDLLATTWTAQQEASPIEQTTASGRTMLIVESITGTRALVRLDDHTVAEVVATDSEPALITRIADELQVQGA